MRLSRTLLPLFLLAVLSACAAKGAADGPASGASPAGASDVVQLLNYDEVLRLMSARLTPAQRSAGRAGFSVVEVELDAGGAVTNSRYRSGGGELPVRVITREVVPRLRFTRPAAGGQRVVVRMAFDRSGRPDVFLEQ